MSEDGEGDEEELHVSPVVLGSTIFGIVTLLIVVTITFEAIQEHFIHGCPKYMRPMVSSLFREMTVLGFLSITLFVIEMAGLLPRISEDVFNHSEEGKNRLKEMFEEVHYLLFAVMVLFICQVLGMLYMANRVVQHWHDMNKQAQNPDDIQRWGIEYLEQNPGSIFKKIFFTRSPSECFFEFYSLRKEFILNRQPVPPFRVAEDNKQLPIHFDYAEYLSICFGMFLSSIINLPPATWLAIWLISVLFYCYYLIIEGNLELFAIGIVVFGIIDLIALIKLQQKCNKIIKKLCNCGDFPKKHCLKDLRADVRVIIAANRLLRSHSKRAIEQEALSEPLLHESEASLPGWTTMKPYQLPKFFRRYFFLMISCLIDIFLCSGLESQK